MTDLATAAARYCAAKDRVAEILRSLKRCERVAYFDGYDENGDATHTTPAESEERQETYCSREVVTYTNGAGYPDDVPLPVKDWCQSCRDNLPAVEELRRVRKSIPGLASAMRRAARRERTA